MSAAQEIGTPPTEGDAPREPAPPMARIRGGHARELRDYFGEFMVAGIAQGSNMGVLLERAAIMAIRLVPCRACGGDIATDRQGTGNCPRRGGNYAKALKKWWQAEAKKVGKVLKDTNADVAEWHRVGVNNVISGETIGLELPDDLTKHCLKCQGSGMIERRANNRAGAVTARPTGSSAHGNPDAMHVIDEEGLQRWAMVNRKLEAVCEESVLARVALGMYYGPTGGSIGCLWQLTDTGDAFIDREPNPMNLGAEQLMSNARAEHAKEPTTARTALFGKIARECAEVWDHTCATWVRLYPEVDEQ